MKELNSTVFEPILGRDEEVLEVYKPNFKREVIVNLILTIVFGGIFLSMPILAMAIDGAAETDDFIVVMSIWAGITSLFIIIVLVSIIFGYKKKLYAVTNKRVIIRSGIIGVDFKTLEFDLVGGISVNVGLMDKLMKPSTGRISFASAASPVVNNAKGISTYFFSAIENPYEVYRRIKDIYDNCRESSK